MPQPLHPQLDHQSTEGTLILQHRPQTAFMIGLIAAEWAHLEEQMAHMFAMATAEVLVNGDQVSLRTQPTAAAAMDALESLSARINVIENAMGRVLPDLLDEFRLLAIAIRKCARGRNDVVHARWAISPKYPDDAVRVEGGTKYIRYVQRDFDEILERILIQCGQIADFNFKCQDVRIEQAKAPL